MNEGKIIFVGLHNKTGMKPLDIRSKSGKLLERIISPLRYKGKIVIKTNLFDIDHVPPADEMNKLAFQWIERVELFKDDTVVLLGQMVHDNFPSSIENMVNVIKIAHPASKRSHKDMDEYVAKTLSLLDKKL